jgi:hypothetical protein
MKDVTPIRSTDNQINTQSGTNDMSVHYSKKDIPSLVDVFGVSAIDYYLSHFISSHDALEVIRYINSGELFDWSPDDRL